MSAVQPEISTETGFPAPGDDFLTYPIHKVVSVFQDPSEVAAAVKELESVGFDAEEIQAFCGWEPKDRREFEGTHRGAWDSFVHAARHIGPARTYVERYEKHLRDGHCMIMVTVTQKRKKERAAKILHAHTGERVTYFGLLMADEVP